MPETIELYVVGRWSGSHNFRLIGIFDCKDTAEKICKDKDYFIVPTILNFELHPLSCWPMGTIYYPNQT